MRDDWAIIRPLAPLSPDQLERNRQAAAEWAARQLAAGPPKEWLELHSTNPELAHILWLDVLDEQRAQGLLALEATNN